MATSGIALPSDDSLALDASDDGALVVDRAGLLWQTIDDLLVLLPAVLRSGSSTLRDAWLQVWGYAVLVTQARAGFTIEAQASPRYAEGLWLDAWGLLLGRARAPLEPDATYRARLLGGYDIVTPSAIKTTITNIMVDAGLPEPFFNEPAVDLAFCGPATTSDPVNYHAKQQTIGGLQTWFAFTQPLVPSNNTAPYHQTVYYGKNLRFWANYTGLTGNTHIGAFAAPLGPGFWIITQSAIGDDGLTPHSEPSWLITATPSTTAVGYDASDFVEGITGSTTYHQSSNAGTGTPSFTSYSYGYVPQAYDTVMDRFSTELAQRKVAGVPWVVMIDYPSQYAF